MADKAFNPFEMAQKQFDAVAEKLSLDQGTCDLLRNPARELHFTIPVRMDNGKVKVFRGFRIQHSDARGPAKGGIRFHPHETIDTVKALATQARHSPWYVRSTRSFTTAAVSLRHSRVSQ